MGHRTKCPIRVSWTLGKVSNIIKIMRWINKLLLRGWFYFLSYLEGVLLTYVLVIIFGQIAVLVTGTRLEEMLIKILAITPGVGEGKNGSFAFDNRDIMVFFGTWGVIAMLISEVTHKWVKIKLGFSIKALLIFGLILHVVSLIVYFVRFGFSFAILFIGVLFLTYLLSIFFYSSINVFRDRMRKLLED